MKRKSSAPVKKRTVKKKTVSPPKVVKEDLSISTPPFHEAFPVTLEHKDNKESKKCYFVCQEHCDSYLKRYKLKKGTYKISQTQPRNEEEA
jgi:hypothetical protein